MWLKFNSSPTVTAVKDTHLALYSFPFPAVNVCPMDKIKRSVAYAYVTDRINTSYRENEMENFLNALTLFQHPFYSRMLYYLESGMDDFLNKLASINITDFMLTVSILYMRIYNRPLGFIWFLSIKVMPTCDEVFKACFWIGHAFNCCELFSLQRSEEGFCYSFNSLTSIKKNDW